MNTETPEINLYRLLKELNMTDAKAEEFVSNMKKLAHAEMATKKDIEKLGTENQLEFTKVRTEMELGTEKLRTEMKTMKGHLLWAMFAMFVAEMGIMLTILYSNL